MNVQSGQGLAIGNERASGVLLSVTSLPNRYGIGDLGPAAHQWVDMLVAAKQRWWQMLPLGPVGEGNSPYKCFSVFAGNPVLISPEALFEDGLLSRSELSSLSLAAGKVNYAAVNRNKTAMLALAWERFQRQSRPALAEAMNRFLVQHSLWLNDFALFMALREARPRQEWTGWPKPILRRFPSALFEMRRQLAGPIGRQKFAQFIFFRQLESLRLHARKVGVRLLGDLPIFVSPDSVDVWTHPNLFQLDKHLRPTSVAGVPPDQFAAHGQRWGNPLYNWAAMERDDFQWWRHRVTAALHQADVVRMDHFRGFEAYWKIPAGSQSAQHGKWTKAPGEKLFESLLRDRPELPLLAEDLGLITPAVEALRDQFGLPGMRVLQFGFDGEAENIHLPHRFPRHCFAYTGTHDNDTTAGWYAKLATSQKARLRSYAPDIKSREDVSWAMIRLIWASVANHVVVPIQDVLSLASSARMNVPGRADHNWQWRLEDLRSCAQPLSRLADFTRVYER